MLSWKLTRKTLANSWEIISRNSQTRSARRFLKEIEGIYQRLIDGVELESPDFSEFLDRIIRIRAIQQFSPSQALGFLFPLKAVIRELLEKESAESSMGAELLEFRTKDRSTGSPFI